MKSNLKNQPKNSKIRKMPQKYKQLGDEGNSRRNVRNQRPTTQHVNSVIQNLVQFFGSWKFDLKLSIFCRGKYIQRNCSLTASMICVQGKREKRYPPTSMFLDVTLALK